MCGIAGLISHEPRSSIGAMLASIEHRGRDDEGVFVSEPFGGSRLRACLGHRRLSIIDTSSAGHQPMFTDDRRFAITLNGEIYNYRDVRLELESLGRRFRTATDTEVLLTAFAEWGTACLDRLNGMFAFAVWDDREKRLTLARDRVGLKPLYYAQVGERLIFGSEIKAILAAGMIRPELCLEALDQYLTFLWPVPPHTLFKHVYHLPAGHLLEWHDGNIQTREWWDLDLSVEQTSGSIDEWSEAVYETLDRVTKMEMVADVPLGAFLSGGVDSSTLVALMTQHTTEPISTYTTAIAAEDLRYDIIPDDVKWARRVAELLPIKYHETLLTPDIVDLIPKLIWHSDAPVIDMAIPSYLISQQARETQTVMLSGMGGDEIFAGYPRQMAMQIAGLTDLMPTSIRRPLFATIESALYGGLPGRLTGPIRNAKKFARSASLDFEDRYLGFGTYFTAEMRSRIYTAETRRATAELDAYRIHRGYFEKCRDLSPINRMLYVDFKTFMPALNLDTTDRTSMAANLEVRAPFLNRDLVELSARIPTRFKINGLKRKFVLKKAAERLLPRDVIWRKKAGFSAPIRSWLRSSLVEMVNDTLSPEAIDRRGLFDASEVRRIIDANLSGKEDYNLQVFQLMTLELWMRQFIDQ